YMFDGPGEVAEVVVVGQFADQADVVLPFDYVSVASQDPDVVKVATGGLMTAIGEGDTWLLASRGNVSAATSVAVGIADDGDGAIAQIFGIDAYPDSVTLIPEGGTRQVVTQLGT